MNILAESAINQNYPTNSVPTSHDNIPSKTKKVYSKPVMVYLNDLSETRGGKLPFLRESPFSTPNTAVNGNS